MRTVFFLLAMLALPAWGQSYVLRADSRGHFFVDGWLGQNKTPIRFMVDTGASGIAIPRSLANLAGEWGNCRWVQHITAAGPRDVCNRRIGQLIVAGFLFKDIDASIVPDESGMALLGMEALNHLRVEMANGVMRLSR